MDRSQHHPQKNTRRRRETAATTTMKDDTTTTNVDPFEYMNGLGNEFETEVIKGALPKHRNNPRLVPYGLYTEQLSGTAFTITPRTCNHRTWTYRIQPSVTGRTYQTTTTSTSTTSDNDDNQVKKTTPIYFGNCNPTESLPTVEPLRWDPPPPPPPTITTGNDYNFRTGMVLMCSGGDVRVKQGINIYMYTNLTQNMPQNEHLCNTDGDFLIVPQQGDLIIHTELGRLYVQPKEICIIPRGITFQVLRGTKNNDDDNIPFQGYILEISTAGSGFQLPDLGPIGSNGLANARDFQIPVAWCAVSTRDEYHASIHTIYSKMDNILHPVSLDHTPYDVVAWYGNYYPYKYNLQYYCAINSVSYDHLDPSIYTVLTCPSLAQPGVALADFVVFPPRIMATDPNTFRPPWFHKNTMSEYMGLIYGTYDAKASNSNSDGNDNDQPKQQRPRGGFVPGGASLHNCMTPHGPDEASYVKAVADPCEQPKKLDAGMAFMFETFLPLRVSPSALNNTEWRDSTYNHCWQSGTGLSSTNFTGWDALLSVKKEQQKT